MATSTFGKQFTVKQEKSGEFVEQMTRTVPPTLNKDFSSKLVHLSQREDLRKNLKEVLTKR